MSRAASRSRPIASSVLGVAGAVLVATTVLPGVAGASARTQVAMPDDTSTAVAPVRSSQAARPAGTGVSALQPHGFASGATGGGGGRVVVVSSAADDPVHPAPGTLRWALAQPGPTWVVFDRDLTVQLRATLQVRSDTTIDGRGHAVTLTGGPGISGLSIADVDNVLVENLTLTDFGDPSRTAHNDPDDAINIRHSTRVWIDHCSLSRAGDKLIGIQDGSQVTVSWNHFADQQQTLQVGSLSTAQRDVSSTVTIDHNWFDHVGYRMPVVSYGKAHVYNNYLDQWASYAIRSERLGQVLAEGNVFRVGSNARASLVTPGQSCNDAGTLCDPRSGYLTNRDNTYIGRAVSVDTGPDHVFNPADAYPYVAQRSSSALASSIVEKAGARGSAWSEHRAAAPAPRVLRVVKRVLRSVTR